MISLDCNVGRLKVDVKFEGKFNILYGDSGTGKTYLFSLLNYYFRKDKHYVAYINYNTELNGQVENMLKDNKYGVYLIDNADIFMTCEYFDILNSKDVIAIVSLKNRLILPVDCDIKFYDVDLSDMGLFLKEKR